MKKKPIDPANPDPDVLPDKAWAVLDLHHREFEVVRVVRITSHRVCYTRPLYTGHWMHKPLYQAVAFFPSQKEAEDAVKEATDKYEQKMKDLKKTIDDACVAKWKTWSDMRMMVREVGIVPPAAEVQITGRKAE